MLSWIHAQHGIYTSLPNELSSKIDFLNNRSSKGFALYFQNDHGVQQARFLLDYLKIKVLENNYRSSMSDLRIQKTDSVEENIERHYLKPRHQQNDDETINQEFGNISILLTIRNELPVHLKFSATAYPDRTFAPSKPFETLMEILST